jgi:hypothetical protein
LALAAGVRTKVGAAHHDISHFLQIIAAICAGVALQDHCGCVKMRRSLCDNAQKDEEASSRKSRGHTSLIG